MLPATLAPPPPFPLIVAQSSAPEFVAPGITRADYRITTNAGPLVVHVVAVDPQEPTVRISVVMARDRLISPGETVSSMAGRTNAVAGINGDYFDIGQTNQPLNVVVSGGVLVRTPSKRAALRSTRAGKRGSDVQLHRQRERRRQSHPADDGQRVAAAGRRNVSHAGLRRADRRAEHGRRIARAARHNGRCARNVSRRGDRTAACRSDPRADARLRAGRAASRRASQRRRRDRGRVCDAAGVRGSERGDRRRPAADRTTACRSTIRTPPHRRSATCAFRSRARRSTATASCCS